MKVFIGLLTALAVISTAHSWPRDKAKGQHSFHFFNEVAKQNDILKGELIARVMQGDPRSRVAEMQGLLDILKDMAKKYGPKALKCINDIVNGGTLQMEAESQDDKLKRELIARVMQGDPSVAEMQGLLDILKDMAKKYGPKVLKCINDIVNGGTLQMEAESQDDKLKRELIARVMQGDPSVAEMQGLLDILKDMAKKYGPKVLKCINDIVNGGTLQMEAESQDYPN